MSILMGIDIGTSGLKCAIVSETGKMLGLAARDYFFDTPVIGYAEQDPNVWWNAAVETIREAIKKSDIDAGDIAGIGLSGQMHGVVAFDRDQNVVRKAILHCDQRSTKQVSQLKNNFPKNHFENITYNPLFPGFLLISLLWIKENEPQNYEKICKVMSVKDYLRYKLTGEIGTEITDASATLAFDMKKGCWAYDLIQQAGIDPDFFSKEIHYSFEIAGKITKQVAELTGLKEGTPVAYGGGDQPMQAIGNGVYDEGTITLTIGTSAPVLAVLNRPVINEKFNTHMFCHACPDRWYSLGAVLSAGSTLNWLKKTFMPDHSFEEISRFVSEIPPCSDGLVFFPCMAGERTPYVDSNTRGIFYGISFIHNKKHFARAVMEGVSFAVKDSVDILTEMVGTPKKLLAAGGVVKSKVWLQILADIVNRELYITDNVEQASIGAAIMAGVGCGVFKDIPEGCAKMVSVNDTPVEPNRENHKKYDGCYQNIYSKLYAQNKMFFDLN